MVNFAFMHRHDHRKPPKTKSGYKGVIFQDKDSRGNPLRKKWKAYIRQHGMYRTIGYFSTAEAAAKAYNEAAVNLNGKDTFLNPVPA